MDPWEEWQVNIHTTLLQLGFEASTEDFTGRFKFLKPTAVWQKDVGDNRLAVILSGAEPNNITFIGINDHAMSGVITSFKPSKIAKHPRFKNVTADDFIDWLQNDGWSDQMSFAESKLPTFEQFFEAVIKSPGAYEKGFPSVHKISSRDIPSLEKTMWMVAYPGGYSRIKWFTADHKNPKLHPTETPDGHIVAIGKADGGRKFKMEFQKARDAAKLCPHDPDTWEPVNIRGGSHKSSGEEIHEAKDRWADIPVKVVVSRRGGYKIIDLRTNKELHWTKGGMDQETLALKLIEAFNDEEWQGGLYPLIGALTRSGRKNTMLEVIDIPQQAKNR